MAFRREPENVKLTKIKKYLDDHKLSYADLGREISFSRDYIARIIKKQRPLTEEFLLRFVAFSNKNRKGTPISKNSLKSKKFL